MIDAQQLSSIALSMDILREKESPGEEEAEWELEDFLFSYDFLGYYFL